MYLHNEPKKIITIVSGIPRSGTSMMMKMLRAGGMDLVNDGLRQADKNNLNGYFEYEKVKNLKEDNSWISIAEGKAIKVLFNFLYFLPQTHKFKIIFMQRDMKEILASQNKMLSVLGKSNLVNDDRMSLLFDSEIEKIKKWIGKQNNIETLYVSYNQILENPIVSCEDVKRFVSRNLEIEKMTKTVDRALYRNKRYILPETKRIK